MREQVLDGGSHARAVRRENLRDESAIEKIKALVLPGPAGVLNRQMCAQALLSAKTCFSPAIVQIRTATTKPRFSYAAEMSQRSSIACDHRLRRCAACNGRRCENPEIGRCRAA